MKGEKDLQTLLRSMKPRLNEGEYVFCTMGELPAAAIAHCLMTFREEEGTTVITTREDADALGWKYHYVAAWITLTIHSSLEAVGLTAAFSTALAKENISCNVVAAFYHDHIFVDIRDRDRAMEALYSVSRF